MPAEVGSAVVVCNCNSNISSRGTNSRIDCLLEKHECRRSTFGAAERTALNRRGGIDDHSGAGCVSAVQEAAVRNGALPSDRVNGPSTICRRIREDDRGRHLPHVSVRSTFGMAVLERGHDIEACVSEGYGTAVAIVGTAVLKRRIRNSYLAR